MRFQPLLVLPFLFVSSLALAQSLSPTPEQIAQFNALSPDEQKRLAEQFGIPIPQTTDTAQLQLTEPVQNRQKPNSDTLGADDILTPDDDQETEDESDDEPDTLYRFGEGLFSSGPEAFLPASDIPIPANYVLGPGDNLVIQLYGKENNSHALTINREGQIQFPQIGPVGLAGLTFSQAQDAINAIVNEQMIGVKSSVTMGALRSIRVFVLGDVLQPGSFTVGSLSTMTNAIFASGGISDIGSMRHIELKRQGELVATLDLYDLLLRGDTSQDKRLLPGDVIFVPSSGPTASISGEIKRPAIYELKDNATAGELIAMAGGPTNNAYLPLVHITRTNTIGERTLVTLDATQKTQKNRPIKGGDAVIIGEVLDHLNEQITLSGHIKRVGTYQWKNGIRFSDLIPSPRYLQENPDINIGLIVRKTKQLRKVEVLAFSPRDAWQKRTLPSNPVLLPEDEVIIFDYEEDRVQLLDTVLTQLKNQAEHLALEKTVTILGSVRFEGNYPLVTHMSIKTLIRLAGGLNESAFTLSAEVTRYELSKDRERIVSHIPVNLNEQQLTLKEGDTLQIKRVPKWKEKETVEIDGEVVFPGTYTLLPGETLLDVIQRAGGLTEYSFPKGAIFSRQNLRDLEANRLKELQTKLESDIAAASVTEKTGEKAIEQGEAETLLKNLSETKPVGRMVIDLTSIINGENDNFPLESGDQLTIPRFKPSVTVLGEVQYPTSHFYDDSLSPHDYIKRSGGTKLLADNKRIYIVKANGRVIEPSKSRWFRSSRSQIEPGDTIIVPLNANQVDPLTVWAKVTTIMYQAALGAAAVNGL